MRFLFSSVRSASSFAPLAPMAALLVATALPDAKPASAQQSPPRVPVYVEPGTPDDVSCDDLGEVANLDPKGDNYLSVQSGPGGKPYVELDRLKPKRAVWICDRKGAWLGVVYGETYNSDCRIITDDKKRHPYSGPCRSGWVAKRYVHDLSD